MSVSAVRHALCLSAAIAFACSLAVAEDPPASQPAAGQAAAFRQACADMVAKAPADGAPIVGKDGFLYLPAELRFLSVGDFWGAAAKAVSKATKPDNADPAAAIIDFRNQLADKGIELLLVPVPPKAVIYPDKLGEFSADPASRVDASLQAFYKELAAAKVNVLDLTPLLLAARGTNKADLYCKTDAHWSGAGCVEVAKVLAQQIRDRKLDAGLKASPLEAKDEVVTIKGDLRERIKNDPPAAESLPLRVIGTKQGDVLAPIVADASSPILLVTDSHGLVFNAGDDMHAKGAGLLDQLSYELKSPVDIIAARGGGGSTARLNFIRKARGDDAWLKGKKLVIWCFTAREFTESTNGWAKLPVTK